MRSILVIQTAFIGDVVLATSLLESIHQEHPNTVMDIAVRKGNEVLFNNHPYINQVLIWNKQNNKYLHLFELLLQIRKNSYSLVINLQRYAATGLLTAFSNADKTIGFNKNPFHLFFTEFVPHQIGIDYMGGHEIERNHQLIKSFCTNPVAMPALYPSKLDIEYIAQWQQQAYICIAPSSVWFTKQFPSQKWIEFIKMIPDSMNVFLLGGPSDIALCDRIIIEVKNQHCINLAGKCSFLQSAALMKNSKMNYVNDSAPLHFCSSVNAPVTVVYCSTIPAFGYGPLSTNSKIIETPLLLACRPCGLHGKSACPLGHFNCANSIEVKQLVDPLFA